MKILVTGATGFIGSHLCNKLYNQGHEVFALARNEEKFKQLKVPGTLIQGTISSQADHDWIKTLPDNLDAIIHTAGLVHSYSNNLFYENNAFATKKLIIDLSHKFPNLSFTLISSLAASGPGTVDESLPLNPISAYGKSKELSEIVLQKLAPSGWIKIIIRPPIVFGPGDHAFLDLFKMINKRIVTIPGMKGKNKCYSFVCIHDLISVILKAIKSNQSSTFFVGHPETISFNKLISTIQKQLKIKWIIKVPIPLLFLKLSAKLFASIAKFHTINIRLTPDKVLELAQDRWICQSNKSEKELNISYNWNIENTIDITYQDYKNRRWL